MFYAERVCFRLDLIYWCETMKYIPLGIRQHMRCTSSISVLSAAHICGIWGLHSSENLRLWSAKVWHHILSLLTLRGTFCLHNNIAFILNVDDGDIRLLWKTGNQLDYTDSWLRRPHINFPYLTYFPHFL